MAEDLKTKTLTRKHRKFIKALAEGKGSGEAASYAGYHPAYASYLKGQPLIQTALQQALERKGLTDDKLAGTIDKGLGATYVKKDGGKKYPDWHARHKYLDTAIKIKGGYAPEKHEIRQEKLTLIVTPETIKGLKDARAIDDTEAELIEAEVMEE